MGFLDKAKAAANELAAKADTALSDTGLTGPSGGPPPDRLFRDLGVLAYLEATGRSADAAERERILGALRDAESKGGVRSFALQTAAPAPGTVPPPPGQAGQQQSPPPPPGAAAQQGGPAPGQTAEQPAGPSDDNVGHSAPPHGPGPGQATPPPPPPSWAKTDES